MSRYLIAILVCIFAVTSCQKKQNTTATNEVEQKVGTPQNDYFVKNKHLRNLNSSRRFKGWQSKTITDGRGGVFSDTVLISDTVIKFYAINDSSLCIREKCDNGYFQGVVLSKPKPPGIPHINNCLLFRPKYVAATQTVYYDTLQNKIVNYIDDYRQAGSGRAYLWYTVLTEL